MAVKPSALPSIGAAKASTASSASSPAPDDPNAPPELATVQGSVMKLQGATLEVGLQDGGLALFDVATKQDKMFVRGEGLGPVKDVTMLGNHPWWVVDGTQFVSTCAPGLSRPTDIDLSGCGLVGPIRRLSVWQEMIVAHADNGIRFIDPESGQILTPEQVLPADVASLADQGVVTTSWKDGAGLFVVIRRYSARTNPKPGEAKELGMLTAWSAPWRGDYKLLGSYTCDIVDFKDAPGPDVQVNGPSGPSTLPHGTGPIGNIQVSADGIVALNSDEALTIPFYKNDWVTQRVATATPPHYAQQTAVSDSDMWWVNDGKLVRASLEDGSSEVYVPRTKDRVLDIAADEDGAWVLNSSGVSRISEEDDSASKLFVKYQAGADTAQPAYGGQQRLAWVLKAAERPGGRKLAEDSPYDFVQDALKTAGVPAKRREALTKAPGDEITDLQYGDVIVQGKNEAIYVGNGQEMTAQNGSLQTLPVTLDQGASIHRFFLVGGRVPFGSHALPIVDIGPVFPIGVNRPDPGLGTDLFVKVDSDSPYDHPYLQSHYELLQIAERWIGTPYRWGGSSMDGTDCSGFVTSVYKELGIKLPRFSQDIARAPFGEVVFDELHFGDVLVYPDPKHCAIYIGDGRTIETTKGAVGYSNVYRRHRAYVRRFLFN